LLLGLAAGALEILLTLRGLPIGLGLVRLLGARVPDAGEDDATAGGVRGSARVLAAEHRCRTDGEGETETGADHQQPAEAGAAGEEPAWSGRVVRRPFGRGCVSS
jgi:hypothetical protein